MILKSCKTCGNTKTSKWYFGPTCGSCYVTANRKKRKDLNPEYHAYQRNFALKKKYGITLKEYNIIFINQNGLCKICLKPDVTKRRSTVDGNLVVDHDHITGKVRGLLCHNCNVALGSFRDSEENLIRAVSYLRDNK